MNWDAHHHEYWREEQEGSRALSEGECPYHSGAGEIGKRCAWLAGYRDARRSFQ